MDTFVSELQRQQWGFKADTIMNGNQSLVTTSDRRPTNVPQVELLDSFKLFLNQIIFVIPIQLVVCELVLQTAEGHAALQVCLSMPLQP